MNSLAEVVVAGSLFLLAFITVLGPLEEGHKSAVQTRLRLEALGHATDLVEEQRALPFDQIQSKAGHRGPFRYTIEVKARPHLRILAIELRWGEQGRLSYGTCIQAAAP